MITFVVPVKNGLSYTRALVDSVVAQNPDAAVEWVIVDTGSTDGTPDYCREIGARLVPFRREPFNYCAAINAGLQVASGDVWIIANNDIEFRSPGDLARVERVFREWPLIAVLSPGRAAGEADLEFLFSDMNGACWAARPSALREWGGLPEAMSGYGFDELYTVYQCWQRGYALAGLSRWDVFHHGSATFGPLAGTMTPALRRNLSRLLRLLESQDLDTNAGIYTLVDRLDRRQWERSPVRLVLDRGRFPLREADLRRQGYANARVLPPPLPADVPRVAGEASGVRERQWLPWLANELLLQPEAPAVGAEGWVAFRPVAEEPETPEDVARLRALARSVGPPAPALMPAVPVRRPTLRQRLTAVVHAWRNRHARLPEEW